MPPSVLAPDVPGFPSSSFKTAPLRHLRVLFVRFMQGLFAASPLDGYRWDPDDKLSQIFITSEGNIDAATMNQRPAISFTRGPIQFYSLGLDDLSSVDVATGRKEKVILVPGTMVVNCVSRVQLEVEDISWIVGEHLWLLRDMLKREGFFDLARNIQIGSPSAAGSIIQNDEGTEYTVVPVSVPFQFPRKSAVTPLNQSVVASIQQSLQTASGSMLFSQGVPTGVNLHECPPESFAPNASDTHGHSPNPAGTGQRFLPKQPHPLDPSKTVTVRTVRGYRPGQHSPHPAPSVPIQDPCVEESD